MSDLGEVISSERIMGFSNLLSGLIDRLEVARDVYYKNHPVIEPETDARHRTFNILIHVLGPVRLGLMFASDHLFSENWWLSQGKSPDGETIEAYMQFLKIGLSNNVYIIVERSFRLCLRALDPAACGQSNSDFGCVSKHLLHLLKLNHLSDTVQIAGLIRNTLHHNGVFSPRDTKGDRVFEYQGHRLEFIVGAPIEFADWMFLIVLAADLIGVCAAVLEHPKIGRLPRIDDPWA